MVVTAPPRPPGVPEFRESEQLEALIKEARRRARLRRLRYATFGVLVASAGAAAVLGPGRGDGAGGTAAPEPVPTVAPWEIKLAGARLAYVPEWSKHELYVTKPDGSGAKKLAACSPGTAMCEIKRPVWSPDGRRIAFLRGTASYPDHPGKLALYVIGLDGRGERRLSACGGRDGECGAIWGSGSPFSWSPDGSQIVFTDGGILSIVDVESARVQELTRCEQPRCLDFGPAWSPDQSAIAFTRSGGTAYALYSVSVRGSQPNRLAAEGMNPAWAPDGRTILVDTRHGITSVTADGSKRALISPTRSPGEGPGVPAWSPDGSRVLYFHTPRQKRGYHPEVWTMKPDGSEKSLIYRGSCCVSMWSKPDWSANGSRVVLSADQRSLEGVNRGGTFVVNANGTRLRKLTRQTAEFDWQPTTSVAARTRR
jgi:Tol biopolymer transport system component